MKHLLNNLTEEEKNSIRDQHTGGMNVVTENFSRLIKTKSGDVKPLVNEQPDASQPTKPTIQPNIGDDESTNQLPKEIQDFVNKYKLTGTFKNIGEKKYPDGTSSVAFWYTKGNLQNRITVEDIKMYESNVNKLSECMKMEVSWKRRWDELQKTQSNTMGIKNLQKTLFKEFPKMRFCTAIIVTKKIIDSK